MKLGFVGGGAMAEAILAGVLKGRVAKATDLTVSDIVASRRDYLLAKYAINTVQENQKAIGGAELVVIAVKPQVLSEVMAGLKNKLSKSQTVVSIVAGATLDAIRRGLGHDSVVRAMPNTPGQVGAGITVWTTTSSVSSQHRKAIKRLLGSLGTEVLVSDEKTIDMATAVSGSGPAYAFLFIEALVDAAVYIGMSRDLARQLATQTILGSATLVLQTDQHLAQLRDMVTSPGGTTAEGLLALEEGEFRSVVMNAVIAAYAKSKELGKEQ